jgi:hypothetical protein
MRSVGKNYLVPTALVLFFLFFLLMAALKPIPFGHQYHLIVSLTFSLLLVWFLYRVRPGWVFEKDSWRPPDCALLGHAGRSLYVFARGPVPRSQFIPIVLYLAVTGIYVNAEKGQMLPPGLMSSDRLRRTRPTRPTSNAI